MDSYRKLENNKHLIVMMIIMPMLLLSKSGNAQFCNIIKKDSVFIYEIILYQKHVHPLWITGISEQELYFEGIKTDEEFVDYFYRNAYYMPEIQMGYSIKAQSCGLNTHEASQLRQTFDDNKKTIIVHLRKKKLLIVNYLYINGEFWKEIMNGTVVLII